MKFRKKMSKRRSKKSFRKGLKSRGANYQSGYVKRGGMRF